MDSIWVFFFFFFGFGFGFAKLTGTEMWAFSLFIFRIGIERPFARVAHLGTGTCLHSSVFGHFKVNVAGFLLWIVWVWVWVLSLLILRVLIAFANSFFFRFFWFLFWLCEFFFLFFCLYLLKAITILCVTLVRIRSDQIR